MISTQNWCHWKNEVTLFLNKFLPMSCCYSLPSTPFWLPMKRWRLELRFLVQWSPYVLVVCCSLSSQQECKYSGRGSLQKTVKECSPSCWWRALRAPALQQHPESTWKGRERICGSPRLNLGYITQDLTLYLEFWAHSYSYPHWIGVIVRDNRVFRFLVELLRL
jgi:hypothetical protein